MKLFDVYPLYDVEIIKGLDTRVWDSNGTEYLDLYGGHAVISIGHAHPRYVNSWKYFDAKSGKEILEDEVDDYEFFIVK